MMEENFEESDNSDEWSTPDQPHGHADATVMGMQGHIITSGGGLPTSATVTNRDSTIFRDAQRPGGMPSTQQPLGYDNRLTWSKFTRSLFEMASSAENSHAVGFSPDGTFLEIRDPKAMENDVLPMYYRHKNLSSFIRQLNNYGFKTIPAATTNNPIQSFYHESFRRGRIDLLNNIVRKSSAGKDEKALKKIDNERVRHLETENRTLKQREVEYQWKLQQLDERNRQLLMENGMLHEENKRLKGGWSRSAAQNADHQALLNSGVGVAFADNRSASYPVFQQQSMQQGMQQAMQPQTHNQVSLGLNFLAIPDPPIVANAMQAQPRQTSTAASPNPVSVAMNHHNKGIEHPTVEAWPTAMPVYEQQHQDVNLRSYPSSSMSASFLDPHHPFYQTPQKMDEDQGRKRTATNFGQRSVPRQKSA